jgi:hypothetical protein
MVALLSVLFYPEAFEMHVTNFKVFEFRNLVLSVCLTDATHLTASDLFSDLLQLILLALDGNSRDIIYILLLQSQ